MHTLLPNVMICGLKLTTCSPFQIPTLFMNNQHRLESLCAAPWHTTGTSTHPCARGTHRITVPPLLWVYFWHHHKRFRQRDHPRNLAGCGNEAILPGTSASLSGQRLRAAPALPLRPRPPPALGGARTAGQPRTDRSVTAPFPQRPPRRAGSAGAAPAARRWPRGAAPSAEGGGGMGGACLPGARPRRQPRARGCGEPGAGAQRSGRSHWRGGTTAAGAGAGRSARGGGPGAGGGGGGAAGGKQRGREDEPEFQQVSDSAVPGVQRGGSEE